MLEKRTNNQDQRFERVRWRCMPWRSACWGNVNGDVAAKLVTENALAIGKWVDAFRPVRRSLLSPLAAFIEDERRNGAQRNTIANVYGAYAADVPDAYARLERVLAERSKAGASIEARVALAKRRANVGVGVSC